MRRTLGADSRSWALVMRGGSGPKSGSSDSRDVSRLDAFLRGGPSAMMMQAPMGAPPVPGPSQGPMQALALLGMQGSQPIFMPMGPEDPRNLQQLPNGSMMHISPWDNAQRMYVPHSYLNPPLNMSTYTSAAAPAQMPMQVPQPPPPQPMQPPPCLLYTSPSPRD